MKFFIKKIILWHKDPSIMVRTLEFLPDKINVITGSSQTGKSTIISIFDYCMLSSRAKFPENTINENVAWYGILININGVDLLLGRKSPDKDKPSNEIYLETTTKIPDLPRKNMNTKDAKSILEKEFGIDEDLKVPYGGKQIKKGSKISFRYFLLFNTLSSSLIADENEFFDFKIHNPSAYREALDRIFYLALGSDNPEFVLINDKLTEVERELIKLERKKEIMASNSEKFTDEISNLIVLAQEYNLIEQKNYTSLDWQTILDKLESNFSNPQYSNGLIELDDLNQNRYSIINKIRRLERFNNQYEIYQKNLQQDNDSLKPVEYLSRHFEQLIQTPEVFIFLSEIKKAFIQIRSEIEGRKTLSTNVSVEINQLKGELQKIDDLIKILPKSIPTYINEAQKFILIGELRAKLQIYTNTYDRIDYQDEIDDLTKDKLNLTNILALNNDNNSLALRHLEELIQKFYTFVSNHMGEYKDYKIYFDIKSKKIGLRNRQQISEIIGSKSNYLFLHIVLFLGLHELFIGLTHSFVPPLLFLDQPSQPYFENLDQGEDTNLDKVKIIRYFSLLNEFISIITSEHKASFQIILLEHVPKSYWEDENLENFHLVEEFRNGNALIPNAGPISLPEPGFDNIV